VQIYKDPTVAILLIQSFLSGAAYQSNLYFIPLYLQNPRQYGTLQSAGFIAALSFTHATFSVLSGQYISRVHRYGELLWAGYGIWTL
jgi:hypothetical protein